MFAMLVGAVTLKLFGNCAMQSQYARVLPVYLVAMFVTTRARKPANVDKFCRPVRTTMYVHLYTLLYVDYQHRSSGTVSYRLN